LNLVNPATGARQDPTLGQINFEENAANISYHALEVSVNQRLWHGLNYDVYYTMASAKGYYAPDDTITFTGSGLQDPLNIAGSTGPLEGLAKRTFKGVLSYAIPARLQNRFAKAVLGGWTLRGIVSARSGLPFNVVSGSDFVGNGRSAGQRPDATGLDPYIRDLSTQVWLNAAAFSVTSVRNEKRFGNLGFYALNGPSSFNIDSGLHKTFIVKEQQKVTFRLEAFNTMNHTVFSSPNGTVNNANFGKMLSARSPRLFQVALKYVF
jgi:hypothetical protein